MKHIIQHPIIIPIKQQQNSPVRIFPFYRTAIQLICCPNVPLFARQYLAGDPSSGKL
jgi:hypothetical protein